MFWSDSATVLKYIASENDGFKPFVAIRDNTKPSRMYLYSERNPANQPVWMQTHSQSAKTGLTGRILIKDKKLWPDPPDMKAMQKNDVEVKGAECECYNASENTLNSVTIMKLKLLLHKLSIGTSQVIHIVKQVRDGIMNHEHPSADLCSPLDISHSNDQTIKGSRSFSSELTLSQRGDKHSKNPHVIMLDPIVQEQKEDSISLHCQQMIRILWISLKPSCVNTDPQKTLTKSQDIVVGL